jgi:VWFA-related protein
VLAFGAPSTAGHASAHTDGVSQLLRALVGCSILAVPLAAQSPIAPPAFRTATEAVEVDVRVTDRDSRPVTGLTAADFELREDGRVQAITSLSFVGSNQPETPASLDAALPNPANGPRPDLAGRAYVLVLDDLHVNAQWSARVVALATEFLQRVTAADRVTVRFTGGGAGSAAEWTNQAAALLPAIGGFTGRKLPAAAIEENERRARAAELSTWTSTADPFARERAINARAAMSTLQNAATSLADVRGRRKAILFISEGIDYDITDAIGRIDRGTEADTILAAMQQAMAAANQTNTSFYAIDPRGSAQNAADVAGAGALDREATRTLRSELMLSQASLREIADTTGGLAAVNMNDLRGFFDRIVADNDAYYMLSYAPPGGRKAGFRKIDVRVKRRDLRVRARPGYLSTAPPEARVAEAPPARTTVASVPVEVRPADPVPDADLTSVLARAARYVEAYEQSLAGIVAEERYQQNVVNMSGPMRSRGPMATSPQRDLRSDLLLVRPAGEDGWIQFRDVFEVDGRAIRDRDERLYKLFVEPTPASRRQAEILQAESARYNIGPLTRTINVPVLALAIASAERQQAFRFRRVKTDVRDLADRYPEAGVWVIEYRETAKGTLIRGAANRDLPSRGRLWIEAATGRVLRTELISEDVQVKAEITVNYGAEAGLDLLVPVEMREDYALPMSSIRIEGRATYSRFRRFTVTTSERPKP